jgi:hypothetical protein
MLVVTLAAAPLFAEIGSLSGPVVGYTQKASAVRSVIGIPGSAYFGPPIETGDLRILAICSEGGYAIGATPEGAGVRIIPLRTAIAGEARAFELSSAVDSVSLSPSGSAAALIHRMTNTVDVITGLPGEPEIRSIQIPSDITAVAISDDGKVLAAGEQAGVLTIVTAQGSRNIAAAEIRHLAFRPNSHDLLYVDGGSGQIGMISQTSSDPVAAIIAGPADGLTDPRAAIAMQHGQRIIIADAGAKELLVMEPSRGISTRLPVPCTPSALGRLSDSVLQLTCESDDLMSIVHLSASDPRVLFVPEPID